MHFKQVFSIKFVINVILLTGLIKSSNADTIGALQDCNTDGETRICVPHSLCKRRKYFVHTYDEKCRNEPNGPVVICCLMSNLLVGVVENGCPSVTRAVSVTRRDQRIENIDVIDCVVHPLYQYSIYTHYILLVKLAKHMEPTYNGATCLWTSNYIDDDTDLNLLYNKRNSYELETLVLKDTPKSHCMPHYEEIMNFRPLRCATASEYPKDSCPFDISSPLFTIVNNVPYVVGFAEFCTHGKPFVYSLISDHISWIEKVIWPDYY
uniref:Uncharacterized protein n=1 Tax=Glossina pallidipes TaxID=7398 RepID=A0A1B0AE43_GLOPL